VVYGCDGLSKAAATGNSTAVQGLVRLLNTTQSNAEEAHGKEIRSVAVFGLEAAANHQNAQAVEALRLLGLR
jgi:hypothetical protein